MSTHAIDDFSEPTTLDEVPRLGVLILYEDFSTGVRAKESFDRIVGDLDVKVDFNVKLWSFDLLQAPALRSQAAAEASRSELIIFSAHGQTPLPGQIKDWIAQWLEQREDRPCALAVLLDGPEDEATLSNPINPVLAEWQSTVSRAGLDLFHRFCQPAPQIPLQPLYQMRERATRSSSAQRESSAGWGINE